jgi:hypothetical protein
VLDGGGGSAGFDHYHGGASLIRRCPPATNSLPSSPSSRRRCRGTDLPPPLPARNAGAFPRSSPVVRRRFDQYPPGVQPEHLQGRRTPRSATPNFVIQFILIRCFFSSIYNLLGVTVYDSVQQYIWIHARLLPYSIPFLYARVNMRSERMAQPDS